MGVLEEEYSTLKDKITSREENKGLNDAFIENKAMHTCVICSIRFHSRENLSYHIKTKQHEHWT